MRLRGSLYGSRAGPLNGTARPVSEISLCYCLLNNNYFASTWEKQAGPVWQDLA